MTLRIMALDFGDKRIGVALSDPMLFGANGLETYSRQSLDQDLAHIAGLVKQHEVGLIVLGWPRNMNGTEGPRCQATAEFGQALEQVVSCPMDVFDERLTTVAAERILLQADMSREKRRKVIDKMAAVVFLQGYLDARAYEKRRTLPWTRNGSSN